MKIDLHTKNVKSLIISVLKPLMYQYTNDTISSFINYWILECQKKLDMSSKQFFEERYSKSPPHS